MYLLRNYILIWYVRMETFHESAAFMLKQFRALLHQQPLPATSARLLQLTALNIFAVETITGSNKGNKYKYTNIYVNY